MTGMLPSVEGAFAVAWFDVDETLWLARDAVGERTLYYTRVGDAIVFASTVHAVLATGLGYHSVNLSALASYLVYGYVPGRETLVPRVHEVLPGEILRFRQGRVMRTRSWSPPTGTVEILEPEEEDEAIGILRMRLEDAVQMRLPVDESVGVLLSGSPDASIIVALARRLHDRPVTTFSISFGPDDPDRAWSSGVAEHFGTEHRLVDMNPDVVLHHLDQAIGLLNEPIADAFAVLNALLLREVAREVGVVLSGEGGDPCFGGPMSLPVLQAELIAGGADGEEDEGFSRERRYVGPHDVVDRELDAMLTAEVREVLADDFLQERLASQVEDPTWNTFITELMALNVTFKGAHHILPKLDAMSAAYGLLVRSPLFDRGIVETAFTMPPKLKLHGGVEKYVLKRSVRDLVPPAFLERPRGALARLDGWFQGPLLAHARERLVDGLAPYRLFDPSYLERLVTGPPQEFAARRGIKIAQLVALEAWLRAVFDN
jgi:asparagine synthase (glutamine-hydrolysing)